MTIARKPASWLFALTTTLIYSAIYFVTRTPQGISHAALMSKAALFDLCLTSSFAGYLILVRNGYCSWRTIAVVGFAGLRIAGLLLPTVYQPHLPSLPWISAPFELLCLAAVVRRFRRRVSSQNDFLAQIRSATLDIMPNRHLAQLIAAEIAVIYYALFSWRAKPETSRDAQVFSCAEASGYRLLGILLVLLLMGESVPLHFLLRHYHPAAAWVLATLDTYGLLWAVALIRSVHLRPILVDEQSIKVRIGIIWEVEIPRDNIISCQRVRSGTALAKTPDYLKALVLNKPQFILELRQPAIATGCYGQRRTITRIGLAVDESEAFASALLAF